MTWSVESLSAQVSPAGRVVLLGVEEAGGVQLTAHERGRALIARGLLSALRPRVTVQPASCSRQHSANKPCSQNSQGGPGQTHHGHVHLSYEAFLSPSLGLGLFAAMDRPQARCHPPGHPDFLRHSHCMKSGKKKD